MLQNHLSMGPFAPKGFAPIDEHELRSLARTTDRKIFKVIPFGECRISVARKPFDQLPKFSTEQGARREEACLSAMIIARSRPCWS